MKNLIFIVLLALSVAAIPNSAAAQSVIGNKEKNLQCEKIREACHHAWNGYKTYASGYDALKPISKKGHNWYGVSFLMTPLDAFDTFYLLGLKEEAKEAKDMVVSKLNFNVDQEVQLFEINIRVMGGLLSSYEFSRDGRLLTLAKNLAIRLLPAFNSPTGMPYRYVNLKTGRTRDSLSNPAEIGTYLLDFGKLTEYTGDSIYYKVAKKAAFEIFKRRSDIDLVGTTIDVNTGEWRNTESQIGKGDSFILWCTGCLLCWSTGAVRGDSHGGKYPERELLYVDNLQPGAGGVQFQDRLGCRPCISVAP